MTHLHIKERGGTVLFKQLLKVLFCENGEASLSKVLTALYFLLFAGVSIYLVVYGLHWQSYEIFAAFAGGGGAVAQVSHKFINSKYNSVPGGFESNQAERK